jgi:preprotein translocase subunit SecA
MAGRKGAVTVATNMAGRGTDIMLGGNSEFLAAEMLERQGLSPVEQPQEYESAWPDTLRQAQEAVAAEHDEVTSLGGLYVLGTERHESRRIDNQLRGRSGRQGDPGLSRFYLSLEDDLMRLFKADIVDSFLRRFNVPDDVPIEAGMVTKAIASAQTQREAQNFEIRKDVLKYDDVLNRQRLVIYEERRRVLEGEDMEQQVRGFIDDTVSGYVASAVAEGYPEDWDLEELWAVLHRLYPVGATIEAAIDEAGGERTDLNRELLAQIMRDDAAAAYDRREAEVGEPVLREVERKVILSVLDRKWREHLLEMDYLRNGIGLRAMAQRDPLVEYQREGFQLFAAMTESIKEESVAYLFNLEVKVADAPEAAATPAEATPEAPGASPEGEAAPEGEAPAGDQGAGRVTASRTAAAPATASGGTAPRGAARVGAAAPAATAPAEPVILAKGLDGPDRRVPLQYSAPSVDGDAGVVRRTEQAVAADKDGETYPGTARNAQCPCGSGKKYKVCHGQNEA